MIKLKTLTQVQISEAFKGVSRQYLAQKLEKMELNARYTRNPNLDAMLKVLRHTLTPPGFEMFLTRLKQLPFESFDAVQSGGRRFIKGKTKTLIVEIPKSRRRRSLEPGPYDIGSYGIYLPYDDLLVNRLENVHFLPDKNRGWERAKAEVPYFHARHLHHYGKYYPGEGNISNPLTFTSSTCWGNFGGIISLTMEAGDLPELFRSLYLFLHIQNINSPLVGLGVLAHYERIQDEKSSPSTIY
jgi:hypothetical protein